jgi:hypothetical protein
MGFFTYTITGHCPRHGNAYFGRVRIAKGANIPFPAGRACLTCGRACAMSLIPA